MQGCEDRSIVVALNEITAAQALRTQALQKTIAKQYQPVLSAQAADPTFKRDTLTLGSVAPQYQIYNIFGVKQANWSINDHYTIKPEDVAALLQDVRQTVDKADLSRMSKTERYEWIEAQYVKAFGKDFMMAYSLELDGTSGGSEYWQIGASFTRSLSIQVGDLTTVQAVNRERLYSGMTTMQIMDTIRSKYPQSLTNRDLMLLVEEMHAVGLSGRDGGSVRFCMSDYVFEATVEFDKNGNPTKESMLNYKNNWVRTLDNRADLSILFGMYNIRELSMGNSKMGVEARNFLIYALGATPTSRGLLEPSYVMIVNEKADPIFGMPDLIEIFRQDLERHDKELGKDQSHQGSGSGSGNAEPALLPIGPEGKTSEGGPSWQRIPRDQRGIVSVFGKFSV